MTKQQTLKKELIRHLYYRGQLTIPTMSKIMHLTVPTVGKLVEDLLSEQLVVVQDKAASNGGRRAFNYALNPDAAYCVVACIERFTMRIAIANLGNEFITPITTVNIGISTPNEMLKMLQKQVRWVINSSDINRKLIIGIGVAVPGLVDKNSGINYSYFGNTDKSLTEIFSKMFPYPVLVQHDLNVMTRAEHVLGIGRGMEHMLYLHVGATGIGLGVILHGELYLGSEGFVGEVGHIPVANNNKLCHCGKTGCLETEVSEAALVAKVVQGVQGGASTMLSRYVKAGKSTLTLQHILQALSMGDSFTIGLFAQMAKPLGLAITIVLHLLNPKMIVLGGELSAAQQHLLLPTLQQLNKYALPQLLKHCKISISTMGNNAPLLGNIPFMLDCEKGGYPF